MDIDRVKATCCRVWWRGGGRIWNKVYPGNLAALRIDREYQGQVRTALNFQRSDDDILAGQGASPGNFPTREFAISVSKSLPDCAQLSGGERSLHGAVEMRGCGLETPVAEIA